jgi:uncharacterized phage infection (PIP) family protein YhgE
MISEDRTRKLSIDAAVAKELKRRAFVVRCLWGLIALAFTLTGWILYKGYTVKSLVKQQVSNNAELVERLGSDTKFLAATSNKVASKTDIQEGITSLLSKDEEFRKRISESTAFTETVAAELESNADFVSRIAKAVPKGTQPHPSPKDLANSLHKVKDFQSELQEKLSSLELRLPEVLQQLEDVKKAIAQYQRNITDIKGRQTHLEESQSSGTRNIEQRLLVLTRDIEALKREYATLPRNYLLKTSQWNDLTALGMKVKIDRKIGEAISEFSVQKEGSVLCKESAVQLGQPFFCDIGTYRYRIELTYFVNRFLVKDYVGMEIVLVPSD